MHFHLPKPLHGWRAFVGEVGIIVLGVLIALSGEQIVGWVHTERELGDAREALRAELGSDAGSLEAIATQDKCVDARLMLLQSWAEGRARLNSAHLASMDSRPLLYTLPTTVWDATNASTIANQMPINERLRYASVYDAIENEKGHVLDERRAWDLLARYAGKQSLTAEESRSLLADLGSVRIRDDDRRFNAFGLLAEIAKFGVKPKRPSQERDRRQLCSPPI
jgi:hypothetical protein